MAAPPPRTPSRGRSARPATIQVVTARRISKIAMPASKEPLRVEVPSRTDSRLRATKTTNWRSAVARATTRYGSGVPNGPCSRGRGSPRRREPGPPRMVRARRHDRARRVDDLDQRPVLIIEGQGTRYQACVEEGNEVLGAQLGRVLDAVGNCHSHGGDEN